MLKQGWTEEEIEDMANLKFKTKKITDIEYQEMIEDLQDRLVALDMNHTDGCVTPRKGMK